LQPVYKYPFTVGDLRVLETTVDHSDSTSAEYFNGPEYMDEGINGKVCPDPDFDLNPLRARAHPGHGDHSE
jgi:hypothetical protein